MNRRESRTSMNERQSDALFEFENCLYRSLFQQPYMAPHHFASHLTVKKKFLLANKHITKSVHVTLWYSSRSDRPIRLNSTLSARIEELNAQISALHVENLRLRASEIALGSQLKKEREKSQRILADAESAVSPHFYLPAWIAVQREAVWPPAFSCLVYFHTSAPHRPRIFLLPCYWLSLHQFWPWRCLSCFVPHVIADSGPSYPLSTCGMSLEQHAQSGVT